jgi:elongation factor Ts
MVDLAQIKELREKTGYGMTAVKKAIEESDGDMEAATILLRKKAAGKREKRSEMPTGEGIVVTVQDEENGVAYIAEFACEQEPTTKNEQFQDFVMTAMGIAVHHQVTNLEELMTYVKERLDELAGVFNENIQIKRIARIETTGIIGEYIHFNGRAGALCSVEGNNDLQDVANDICMHLAASEVTCLDRESFPPDLLEQEKELMRESVKDKPENIQDKIIEGKLNKLYAEQCLLEQPFVKDSTGKTKIKDLLRDAKLTGYIQSKLGVE